MSDYYQFRDETVTPVDYYQLVNDNNELCKEIERLNKENNDLRKLYQRTYKHLFEIDNDELARYFQAQIDECPTFYVEPIIDYYEETKRLNNIIKEVREKVNNFDVFKEFTFPLMKRNVENQVKSSIDYEWKKSIKEPILEILDKADKGV